MRHDRHYCTYYQSLFSRAFQSRPNTDVARDQGNAEFKDTHKELKKLKPQMFVFMHKICNLVTCTPFIGLRQLNIRRLDLDEDFDGKKAAILIGKKNMEHRYIIVRRIEIDLEKDYGRDKITDTETMLAFPIDDRMRPVLHSQHTYTYLPMDDYGFNLSESKSKCLMWMKI
jgi:hypothetical protein